MRTRPILFSLPLLAVIAASAHARVPDDPGCDQQKEKYEKQLCQRQQQKDELEKQVKALEARAKSASTDVGRDFATEAAERRKKQIEVLKEIIDLLSMRAQKDLLDMDETERIQSLIEEREEKLEALKSSIQEGTWSNSSTPPASETPPQPRPNLAVASTSPEANAENGHGGSREAVPLAGAVNADSAARRESAPVATRSAGAETEAPAPTPSEPQTRGLAGGKFVRSIVGFEQAGASAAESTQKFFFNLFVSRPLPFDWKPRRSSAALFSGDDIDLGPRTRVWGDLRITSVPQQINASVAEFSNTFAQRVGNLKVNEVAQSAEFLGGISWRLFQTRNLFASSDRAASERFSFHLVFGAGVITPLTPKDSVRIFQVPQNQPDFQVRFPSTVGKQFVAFTLPDRDRFFRQAYGGIRMMTHFLDRDDSQRFRPPAFLDVTWGVNESVTGGKIRGSVIRLEGFLPIPYSAANSVYFYGTALFKPVNPKIMSPFLLDAAPAGTLPTDPNAVVITVPQIDRDYYRLGVGVDLIHLVAKWRENKNEQKQRLEACQKHFCELSTDPEKKKECEEKCVHTSKGEPPGS